MDTDDRFEDEIASMLIEAMKDTPLNVECITYGSLTGLLRILDMVQDFPSDEPTDVAGWCRVYETVLTALEELPLEGISAEAHADLIVYVRQKHAYYLASEHGAPRGDPHVLWTEWNTHRAEFDRDIALLGRHVHGEIDLRSEEWIPESMR